MAYPRRLLLPAFVIATDYFFIRRVSPKNASLTGILLWKREIVKEKQDSFASFPCEEKI